MPADGDILAEAVDSNSCYCLQAHTWWHTHTHTQRTKQPNAFNTHTLRSPHIVSLLLWCWPEADEGKQEGRVDVCGSLLQRELPSLCLCEGAAACTICATDMMAHTCFCVSSKSKIFCHDFISFMGWREINIFSKIFFYCVALGGNEGGSSGPRLIWVRDPWFNFDNEEKYLHLRCK